MFAEINRKDFQKWLETFPENGLVGYQKSCGACPIAKFILSLPDFEYSFVSPNQIQLYYKGVNTSFQSEIWIREFIIRIDRAQVSYVGTRCNKPIMAIECLRILDEMPLYHDIFPTAGAS